MEVEKKRIASLAIGKAGELRIRSELLLRGFHPAVCDYDQGTDIILENGKKIGVKTASRPIYQKRYYSWKYHFSIKVPKVRWEDGKGRYKKVYLERDWKNYVDFWILWCIQHDIFYIIPREKIRQKFAFCVPAPPEKRRYKKHTWKKSKSKYEKYKNNWEQLRQ